MLLRSFLSLLLLAASLEAQSSSPYGINVHAPREERLPLVFDKVAQAGIAWVRVDLVWAFVEPEPGLSDWEVYDDIIEAARSRNLDVLMVIAYTPAWATDGPEISGVPRNVSDWSDFCYRAAERYRDDVDSWEIWNEPNLRRFWTGSRLEYIERILRPASAAIRAADPDALIAGPGLAHLVSRGRDWHGWLLDILREAGDDLDLLTHHAYDLDGPEGVTQRLAAQTPYGSDAARWGEVQPSLREVLDWVGWDRPVWLTETGWVTTRLDETLQARHYRGFLEEWLTGGPARSWLAKVFFYEIQDDRDPRVDNYGILRVSGREKPAYRVYRDFIAAQPAAPEDGGESPAPPDSDPGGERSPRQLEPEAAASLRAGVHADAAAVSLHGEFAEGEAETGRVIGRGLACFEGPELFEDPRSRLGRDAGPLVLHGHSHAHSLAVQDDAQSTLRRCVLDAVADQVLENPFHDRPVAFDLHRVGRLHGDGPSALQCGEARRHLSRHAGQVTELELDRHLPLLEPARVEYVVGHAPESLGGSDGRAQVLGDLRVELAGSILIDGLEARQQDL